MPGQVSLPLLHGRFRQHEAYEFGASYSLLPFRFTSLDDHRVVLSNFAGEHYVLARPDMVKFARHELTRPAPQYNELKSRHFLLDDDSNVAVDLLATQYRTRIAHLSDFTKLFIFVVTLRCDHSCQYCQVSRQSSDQVAYDMNLESADRAVDFMFKTPSRSIKIEFQGGESLLNFELIRHIVKRVQVRNVTEQRHTAFVIATNLYPLTDEHLAFCHDYDICISTSLDGPQDLHNHNRPHPNRDSYQGVIRGIRRVREALGHDRVAALMTTSAASLNRAREIVDEYIAQGFDSVFLRPLSPFGFAAKSGKAISAEAWLKFYCEGLDHILSLNQSGRLFFEQYAAIILKKILSSQPTQYVDLQSPAGVGISTIVFNYNGNIYASDESRMLAEMGDETFLLGNLIRDPYERVMTSAALLGPVATSMTEGVPMCCDCAFQPYCGSSPVFHYVTQGDVVGFKPSSAFCRRNMGIFRKLLLLLEDNPTAARTLHSWVR